MPAAPEGVDEQEWEELQDWMSDDEEGLEEDLTAAGTMESNFAKLLVVDNIPKVGDAKKSKLESIIRKIFSQFGEFQDDGMVMPMVKDEKGQNSTLGFCFVAYQTAEAAAQAVQLTDGFKLDKKHIFKVNRYVDLEKYGNWPDEYTEPMRPEFKAPENIMDHLLDEAGRDQYIIRQGPNTEVYFCEGAHLKGEGALVYGGEREKEMGKVWCELYTAWSPKGTYLATYHRQGIALWGGLSFTKLMRFKHFDVQCLEFSPCEGYLMTWNGKDDGKDPNALMVFDVQTGKMLRSFKVNPGSSWPIFRWSHDDKFFARGTTDGITVFETPSMKMLEKKPVRAKGMVEFSWCPSKSLIAYWAPEQDNIPARVVIIDPVRRSEVRAKNLFAVSEVKLHWHSDGAFLCAQVLRHTKSKKTTFTNLEIFRMLDPNIPNEMHEIKERVEYFAWEPGRERFGVIHGDSQIRFSVSFYTMGSLKGGAKVEKLYTITDRAANQLHWSPRGNAVVLAGMNTVEVKLEFFDVDENLSTANAEHFMCNEIAWDPSGRILATVATQPMFGTVAIREKLGNGFNLWTFQGNNMRRVQTQHFYQFAWRPRPASLLTEKEIVDVTKNLKKSMAKFEKLDLNRTKLMNAAENLEKLRQLTDWRNLMDTLMAGYVADSAERIATGLWVEEKDEEFVFIDETIEEVLSEKTTPFERP